MRTTNFSEGVAQIKKLLQQKRKQLRHIQLSQTSIYHCINKHWYNSLQSVS